MVALNPDKSGRQSASFMYLYTLAAAGGAVAYMPFLTILLPLRATDIAGNGALEMLAMAAFLGAIAASVANIAFGWASDKTGERRPWTCAGLAVSTALLLATAYAKSPAAMIATLANASLRADRNAAVLRLPECARKRTRISAQVRLTANAPNPAGFSILKGSFPDGAISPLRLLISAAVPTLIAACLFLI